MDKHNIIGISFGYHDASCCLIQNGELVASVQEERFTRLKNDSSVPVNSFHYCLTQSDVDITEIDKVVFYEDPYLKLTRQVWMGSNPKLSKKQRDKIVARVKEPHWVERQIREKLGFQGEIAFVQHHMSHAASSFYMSDFDEASILTVDGVGEWECLTMGYADINGIKLTYSNNFPDSIGLLYSSITAYLGFKVNSGEYKVMGLAPYGKAHYVEHIYNLIEFHENEKFKLNLEYFSFLEEEKQYSNKFVELFGMPARKPTDEIEQFHMDVAKSIQIVIEELLLEKAEYLYSVHPSKNLCMAGGVALNCVAIGNLYKKSKFENIFVMPAAGDSGGAIGAAAHIYFLETGKKINSLKHAFLGPAYSQREIEAFLNETGINYEIIQDDYELALKTARYIAKGKVIGWFQGRMEFGPRALGSRSILADPRNAEMRVRINGMVKKRESFRPFAPSVLEEMVGEHFSISRPSPYMLETCQVKSPIDLPAITHVDGSGRLQTVDYDRAPKYHQLISAFYELTGCPLVLNTSFNMRGEPIVCAPLDAINCFVASQMDVLVLENCLILKEDIPKIWTYNINYDDYQKVDVSQTVYMLM